MSSADQDRMKNWAKSHGKCVRQRTVRQETTKYKAGTLPLSMYQTAVQRGERLEFVPVENEDNEDKLESVSRERGREDAFAPSLRDSGLVPVTFSELELFPVALLLQRSLLQLILLQFGLKIFKLV